MNRTILHFNSSMGYWADEWSDLSVNSSIYVTVIKGALEEDIDEHLSISNAYYTPTAGDRIYFLPEVTVPRIKFKALSQESGIRTVNDHTKANVFIGNQKSINKITSRIHAYKVNKQDFIDLLMNENFHSCIDNHHLDNIQTALEFYTEDFVFVDMPLNRLISRYVKGDPDNLSEYSAIYKVVAEFESLALSIGKTIIYDESTIIDQLNGDDAAVINSEVYDQLCTMLDSSDTDNHVLAMEIMANCKYSSSIVYLTLLFYYYHGLFYMSKTKNHVNFKSLIAWISCDNALTINSKKAITILKEKGKLTKENVDLLLSYIGDDVVQNGQNEIFSMKYISLNPNLLSEMGMDYSYRMQEDYVSVVNESEETLIEVTEVDMEEITTESFNEISGLETNKQDFEEVKQGEDEIINEAEETLITLEPESNNHQITEKDESDEFDWF